MKINVMKAESTDKPFDKTGWLFETKYDGIRAIVLLKNNSISIISRNNEDITFRFPELQSIKNNINAQSVILDGEITCIKKNISNFNALQGRINLKNHQKINSLLSTDLIQFVAFDILMVNDEKLESLPLIRRKEKLSSIASNDRNFIIAPYIIADGIKFSQSQLQENQEGIMAKKCYSTYQYNKRSSDWLKIKFKHRQEVVIGGFTEPKNSRECFGSLVIGVYENKKLIHTGNVGTGFTVQDLNNIYDNLSRVLRNTSPFDNLKQESNTKWVEPVMVCEIEFLRVTEKKHFYQPVFLGIRLDKNPKEIKLEYEHNN